ncbi:hypothetical protein KAJ83_06700 [Marivibrio halodurans]|uniref:Uncharacterized protein n=1 Tax=Marivibrio halodurans TaxID=2039722 RepID=A0A8J7RYF8_9PROT|nr:hypothetical protein [Marivibrio halodurans]MBP5856690.1 hypothetical protein [Marivibrio halodurans]
MDGTVCRARRGHLSYVLNGWRGIWRRKAYYVDIPADLPARLRRARERTGCGPKALLDGAHDAPDKLTEGMIRTWLSGSAKRARKDHLDWTLARWEGLPDETPAEPREPEKSSRVPIDEARRARLRALRRDTGLSPPALLQRLGVDRDAIPSGLSGSMIAAWLAGSTKTARRDHLAFIEDAWRHLAAREPGYIPLDAVIVDELRASKKRSGIGETRLLQEAGDKPEGLTPSVLRNWLSGQTATARADHLAFVREAWAACPSRGEVITLTDGDVARLKGLMRAVDTGPGGLLRGARHEQPDGLTSSIIRGWLSAPGRQARREHFEFVIARLQGMMESGEDRIALTPAHIDTLQKERARSGVEIADLARRMKADRGSSPAVTEGMIHRWLAGTAKSAKRCDYEAVLSAWRACPDLSLPDPALLGVERFELSEGRVVITEAMRAHLMAMQERSGKGGVALVAWAEAQDMEIPDGLDHTAITQWLSGARQSAPPEHLRFAATAWNRAMEDAPAWVPLTKELRRQLAAYHAAGLLPSKIFKGATDKPEGLSATVITGWLKGGMEQLRADHRDWVLARCAHLSETGESRVPLTAEIRARLEEARARSGMMQAALLKSAPDVPQGLTANTISAWINGTAATARKDHLDWVLARWTEHVEA